MGNFEIFAGQAIEKITCNGFPGSETDGMNQSVKTAPFFFDFCENVFDLLVAADVAFSKSFHCPSLLQTR